ncbi:hypothetical protein JKF63_06077 [Porcisia hertigi]|uniref:Uncharacterized protein n=1 Tax=Porcisia hertigi TaxID=2761500 RepID=A0A836IBM3_9TRYP|nr:hypothetical protein JKF63_06077 [Porcisia hertigi]
MVHDLSIIPRQYRRRALTLLAAFVGLVCLSTLCVSAISDAFENVPNAFRTSGTAVRAVYEAGQLTSRVIALGSGNPLCSDAYVLCAVGGGTEARPTGAADGDTVLQGWCASHQGTLINQSVCWSTLAPPGLQRRDASMVSSRALSWDCLTYSCDMEDTLVGRTTSEGLTNSTTGTYAAPLPAVGGLGVATPCCGSTNSTFVLYMTRGLIVQSATLPLIALNEEAAALYSAFVDRENARYSLHGSRRSGAKSGAPSSSKSSPSTTGEAPSAVFAGAGAANPLHAAPDRSKEMDFCLVRQLPSFLYAGSTRSRGGDGGAVFSVNASICGVDISDRIDVHDVTLLMRGYTAVLSTAEGVEQLSFPKELIVGIASWLTSTPGTAPDYPDAEHSLLRTKKQCTWRSNARFATAYRTGEYFECLFDPSALPTLPPLVLSVRSESIISTAETSNTCGIAVSLSSCMNPEGTALRFYSTGSLADEFARHRDSIVNMREPVIVVGMQQLRGATVAVTRSASVPQWIIGASNVGSNLPLLYLAVPRGTAVAADVNATGGALCVASTTCVEHQTFYPSLNRCVSLMCRRVFLYSLDADKFNCVPRKSLLGVFAAACAALVLMEGVVLYLRRKTELAKEEHMRLVLQVQRRSAEAQ